MSEAMKILYDEHHLIVNVLDLSRAAGSFIDKDNAFYEKSARELIQFFRKYADGYHHHKEELILFPEMSKRNELLEGGVLKEMLDNHNDFRESVRSIEKSIDLKNFREAQQQMEAYGHALLDHIAAENEEVFPMAETLMDESELEKIYYRFLDCDRELGDQLKTELADFVDSLRLRLMNHAE